MGLFPFTTDEDEDYLEDEDVTEDTDEDSSEDTFTEYEIDFNTMRLTGNILEGVDALEVWAKLALKSDRYNHPVYTWNYGEEFSTLIGNSYDNDYLVTEVGRMVKECLTVNPHITGISNLDVSQEKDKLSISFTMLTDQGETEVSTDV